MNRTLIEKIISDRNRIIAVIKAGGKITDVKGVKIVNPILILVLLLSVTACVSKLKNQKNIVLCKYPDSLFTNLKYHDQPQTK